jgi:hypothetical protein
MERDSEWGERIELITERRTLEKHSLKAKKSSVLGHSDAGNRTPNCQHIHSTESWRRKHGGVPYTTSEGFGQFVPRLRLRVVEAKCIDIELRSVIVGETRKMGWYRQRNEWDSKAT